MTIVAGAVAGAVVAVVSVAVTGRVIFERRISTEIHQLFASSNNVPPAVLTQADIAGLPDPARRWLRQSRAVGQERPAAVRLKQTGQFRLSEERGWMPFTAEEYYTTNPPGFIWVPTFKMAPLLTISGRDRYIDGAGSIDMRLLSVIPAASKSGGGLQGALLRYLNEIMWFPAAAVNAYITWEGINANCARATMSYGGVTASAVFIFDAEGRLTDMTAERYNDAKATVLPWSTPITAYGEFGGMRIPVAGEGKWTYEAGDFTYIRLRVTNAQYNRPEEF